MDREAIALRNRAMTEAFHRSPLKHQVRSAMLTIASKVPIASIGGKRYNRTLVIRPDHLGDVLLSTPAIRALKAALPEQEIHALVGPWSAEVMAAYPEIETVLTLDFPGFSRRPKVNWRSPYELAFEASRQLRRIGYDSAIIMRPDHWWGALVAQLAGIPRRIGYDLPDVAPFLTNTVSYQREHSVIQNLRLVEPLGVTFDRNDTQLTFPIDPVDDLYVSGYLEEWRIQGTSRLICIHTGAGTTVKQWPEAKWVSVADTLAEQLEASIILTGSDHELPTARRIAGQMKQPSIVMAGDTRVGQLAALFKRSKLVLGADIGPLHLAAAVGTPTVSLFGPADPVEFGPWGSSEKHLVLTSDIACRPCRVLDWSGDDLAYHPCVRDINVARVLEAGRRAFQASEGR